MKKIFVCTSNEGKLREFGSILGPNIEVVGIKSLQERAGIQFHEPVEDGNTFFENARIKALCAANFVFKVAELLQIKPNELVDEIIVDDSGLCVRDLNGSPGVHSAYFGGLPRNDAKNRKYLAKVLEDKNLEESAACFICMLVSVKTKDKSWQTDTSEAKRFLAAAKIIGTGFEEKVFLQPDMLSFTENVTEGDLVLRVNMGICRGIVKPVEQNLMPGEGHGYDSLFYAPEFNGRSFGSVSLAEKNCVSHRARALAAFLL